MNKLAVSDFPPRSQFFFLSALLCPDEGTTCVPLEENTFDKCYPFILTLVFEISEYILDPPNT